MYDGSVHCQALYPAQRPPVPYSTRGGVEADVSLLVESGFKEVRGRLTEGRYLVFEIGGAALANSGGRGAAVSEAVPKHDLKSQRWIAHVVQVGGDSPSAVRWMGDGCRQTAPL